MVGKSWEKSALFMDVITGVVNLRRFDKNLHVFVDIKFSDFIVSRY
jgi:hypothetical protein